MDIIELKELYSFTFKFTDQNVSKFQTITNFNLTSNFKK